MLLFANSIHSIQINLYSHDTLNLSDCYLTSGSNVKDFLVCLQNYFALQNPFFGRLPFLKLNNYSALQWRQKLLVVD